MSSLTKQSLNTGPGNKHTKRKVGHIENYVQYLWAASQQNGLYDVRLTKIQISLHIKNL